MTVLQLFLMTKRLKKLTKGVLTQCSAIAADLKTIGLINIRQKADKPFEASLSQLMETKNKTVPQDEAAQIITKQLPFENTNFACQTLLRQIRKSDLNEFLRVCSEVTPSYEQEVAIATAF